MTRVFKVFVLFTVALSDETDAGSAGTQPAQGYSDRGCVKDAACGSSGQSNSEDLFSFSDLAGGLIHTAPGNFAGVGRPPTNRSGLKS